MRGVAVVVVAAGVLAAPAGAQLPELPPLGGQPPIQPPISPPPRDQPLPQPFPPPSHGTVATEGANPARSGLVGDYTLVPPLIHRWSVHTNAVQLLAAGGRVFEIGPTARVRARSARTGRILWGTRRPNSSYGLAGAAYDRGIVFLELVDRLLAFGARDGRLLWKRDLDYPGATFTPVAAGGVVYAYDGSAGALALRGRDGRLLWSNYAVGGTGGGVLDQNRVYFAGACANAQALSRRTGEPIWTHTTGCSGGGDVLGRLYGGRLYVPEEEYTGDDWAAPPILSARTGRVVDRTRTRPFAFDDGVRIAQEGGAVVARRAASGRRVWRLRHVALTAALAVGHQLLGIDEELGVVDAATGIPMWVSSRRFPDPSDSGDSPNNIAADRDTVFVSAGGRLHAYGSGLRPSPGRIGFRGAWPDVFAGDWSVLVGVLGARLRRDDPEVQISAARWPRGRFTAFRQIRSTGGGARGYSQLFRNTRFRAAVRGRRSRSVTVYAWPKVLLGKARRSGGYVHVPVTVHSPRTDLSGHRLYLYISRGRSVRLIGGDRLHGRAGRSRATVSFRPLRHVSKKNLIYACVRGALGKGLGRPLDLTRHCGAERARRSQV